ncbi:MAG TPA: AAA family ATPase, partial [Solirubrobacteraceae bacterium]
MTPLERLTDARSAAVERIAQTADEQPFTGLVGEADVGKTVLLHTALKQLRQAGWRIVALDLDGAWSPNRLAWRWARELTRAVAGTVVLSHLDALSPDMWPASTRNALLHLPKELNGDVARLAEASQPPRGVGKPDVLEAPARATLELAERQRLLVVIDHLEAPKAAGLSSPDAEQLLWRLRSAGQYQRNLHVLVCARPPAQDFAAGANAAYHLDGRWLTLDPPTPREFSHATDADPTTSEAVHTRT